MINVNKIIANNVAQQLKKQNKKQIDLARVLGVSKQIMSKMMVGARTINAIELSKIAAYLKVPMETLVAMPETRVDFSVAKAFMGNVETKSAEDALQIADEVADMILFHMRVKENSESLMETWRP